VTALRDVHDTIIGYLMICTDNTIRRRIEDEHQDAEDARRRSDARYQALFECAPDGILIADKDSTYLDVNGSMCRMLGYTRDEVIGMHASNIVAESELLHIGPALDSLNATSVHEREWRFERKDRSQFDANVLVTKMPGGNLLAMVHDITERKRADKRTADTLRELNHVKGALDEHAIIAITDARGTITYVNDKFCSISQYPREELLGRDHRIINSGCHPKAFIRDLWQTIKAGRVWHGEIQNRAKDGSLYWVDTTIVPYLGDGGELVQFIAIRADITEHKRVLDVLQQKNAELEAASRLKSEFLANMSHELRTPLNAIIGFSEVLGDGLVGELTPQQRGFIGDIFSSGNHLLALINDILDLSKVEAGKMRLDCEAVPIVALIERSLLVVRGKAAAHRVRLEIDVAGAPTSIEADPRKITQIVYNLLSNAVKFSADGGCVTLRAALVQRDQVGLRGGPWPNRQFPLQESPYAEFLEISVTDAGLGISSHGLGLLFTPFSQIDGGLARRFEGTGLGLAMVKRLAELHGGTIAVESALGVGSRFIVWLPAEARVDNPGDLTSAMGGSTALRERPKTARIPIVAVTATEISAQDRGEFKSDVAKTVDKADCGSVRLTAEVRPARVARDTEV
jgi:PAS domain S-box-containing protein